MLSDRVKATVESSFILCVVIFLFSREIGPDVLTMAIGHEVLVVSVDSTKVEREHFPAGPGNQIPSFSDMTPSAVIVYTDVEGNLARCRIVGHNKLFGSGSEIDHGAYEAELNTLRQSTNLKAQVRVYPRPDCYLHSPFTFIHAIFSTALAYCLLRFIVVCFDLSKHGRTSFK